MRKHHLNMTDNIFIRLFYRVATGSKKYRNILTPIGALIFFTFFGCIIFLSLITDKLFELPGMLTNPVNYYLCAPFFLGGVFLIVWSISYFIKADGTPVPFNPPETLVVKGPYARMRNPMLSGVFMVLLGIAILTGSYSMILIYLPLFIFLAFIELKKIEEPELEKRLGKKYVDYKNKTPMFIPRIIKRSVDRR